MRPLDRRTFLQALLCGGAVLATGTFSRLHSAAAPIRIGFVTPGSGGPRGQAAARAASLEMGLELGVEEAARAGGLLGVEVALLKEEGADPGTVRSAGEKLLDEGVIALLGGSDEAAERVLGELAEERGVAFLALGRDGEGAGGLWSADAGARSCAGSGIHSFHLALDDESARCRAMVETLRAERAFDRWIVIAHDAGGALDRAVDSVERAGGTLVATLAGVDPGGPGAILRLAERSAADAILLPGAPSLRSIEPYAAHEEAIPLVFTRPPPVEETGESPLGSVATFWPALWHPALSRYGAARLNARFADRFGRGMDTAAWLGWLALKVVWETGLRMENHNGDPFSSRLRDGGAQFDGHKGRTLSFRSDGLLRQPLFVFASAGDDGVEVLGEVPVQEEGERFEDAFDRFVPGPAPCATDDADAPEGEERNLHRAARAG